MSPSIEIQKQIQELQQQADEFRKAEIDKVIGMLHTST